jgi:hypothetical protein
MGHVILKQWYIIEEETPARRKKLKFGRRPCTHILDLYLSLPYTMSQAIYLNIEIRYFIYIYIKKKNQ